jgi:hypothetical protein
VFTVMSDMDLSHDLWGYGWLVLVRVGSSQSGSWYATGAKPVCMFWLHVGCL